MGGNSSKPELQIQASTSSGQIQPQQSKQPRNQRRSPQNFKAIAWGPQSTGRSRLMECLLTKRPCVYRDIHIGPEMLSFKTPRYKNKIILWDLKGQDFAYSQNRVYLRNSDAAIIALNGGSHARQPEDGLENLGWWFKTIQEFNPGKQVPIILVITQADDPQRLITLEQALRKVACGGIDRRALPSAPPQEWYTAARQAWYERAQQVWQEMMQRAGQEMAARALPQRPEQAWRRMVQPALPATSQQPLPIVVQSRVDITQQYEWFERMRQTWYQEAQQSWYERAQQSAWNEETQRAWYEERQRAWHEAVEQKLQEVVQQVWNEMTQQASSAPDDSYIQIPLVCETSAVQYINIQEILVAFEFVLAGEDDTYPKVNPDLLYFYSKERPGELRAVRRDLVRSYPLDFPFERWQTEIVPLPPLAVE